MSEIDKTWQEENARAVSEQARRLVACVEEEVLLGLTPELRDARPGTMPEVAFALRALTMRLARHQRHQGATHLRWEENGLAFQREDGVPALVPMGHLRFELEEAALLSPGLAAEMLAWLIQAVPEPDQFLDLIEHLR